MMVLRRCSRQRVQNRRRELTRTATHMPHEAPAAAAPPTKDDVWSRKSVTRHLNVALGERFDRVAIEAVTRKRVHLAGEFWTTQLRDRVHAATPRSHPRIPRP
jgi:hypothetical protein